VQFLFFGKYKTSKRAYGKERGRVGGRRKKRKGKRSRMSGRVRGGGGTPMENGKRLKKILTWKNIDHEVSKSDI